MKKKTKKCSLWCTYLWEYMMWCPIGFPYMRQNEIKCPLGAHGFLFFQPSAFPPWALAVQTGLFLWHVQMILLWLILRLFYNYLQLITVLFNDIRVRGLSEKLLHLSLREACLILMPFFAHYFASLIHQSPFVGLVLFSSCLKYITQNCCNISPLLTSIFSLIVLWLLYNSF